MKYETLKAGTLVEYKDQGLNEYTGKWSELPNCMIGRQVCAIRVRRPIAEDFTVPNYAKACEGDRIGPFTCNVEASRFACQIAKTHTTHMEWGSSSIYLVVNRHYAEAV